MKNINYEKISNILIGVACVVIIIYMLLALYSCSTTKYGAGGWKQSKSCNYWKR